MMAEPSSVGLLRELADAYLTETIREAECPGRPLGHDETSPAASSELQRYRSLFLMDPCGIPFFDVGEEAAEGQARGLKHRLLEVVAAHLREEAPATHIKEIAAVRKPTYKALFDLRVMIIDRIPASGFNNAAVSDWLFWIVADASGAGILVIVPSSVSHQIYGDELPSHSMKNQAIIEALNDRYPVGSILDIIGLKVTCFFGVVMFTPSRKARMIKRGYHTLRHSLDFTSTINSATADG